MAPLMVIGRALRNRFRWPALRLDSDAVACGSCTSACPMSIDVAAQVAAGVVETTDCILCASCADACARRAINLRFGGGGQRMRAAARPQA
jgi:ferredoxin-type protein NapH